MNILRDLPEGIIPNIVLMKMFWNVLSYHLFDTVLEIGDIPHNWTEGLILLYIKIKAISMILVIIEVSPSWAVWVNYLQIMLTMCSRRTQLVSERVMLLLIIIFSCTRLYNFLIIQTNCSIMPLLMMKRYFIICGKMLYGINYWNILLGIVKYDESIKISYVC